MARNNEKTNIWTVTEIMEPGPLKLKGKVFSITGHLGVTRDRVVQLIDQAGGRYEERPNWGVHFLITNADWNTGIKVSSKYEQAKSRNIKIITEEEFIQMLIGTPA